MEKLSKARAKAELTLRFREPGEAELAARAVAPDNHPLPPGLKLEMFRDGERLVFRIESERNVSSLLATLDDILSMVRLALKVSRAVSP